MNLCWKKLILIRSFQSCPIFVSELLTLALKMCTMSLELLCSIFSRLDSEWDAEPPRIVSRIQVSLIGISSSVPPSAERWRWVRTSTRYSHPFLWILNRGIFGSPILIKISQTNQIPRATADWTINNCSAARMIVVYIYIIHLAPILSRRPEYRHFNSELGDLFRLLLILLSLSLSVSSFFSFFPFCLYVSLSILELHCHVSLPCVVHKPQW